MSKKNTPISGGLQIGVKTPTDLRENCRWTFVSERKFKIGEGEASS